MPSPWAKPEAAATAEEIEALEGTLGLLELCTKINELLNLHNIKQPEGQIRCLLFVASLTSCISAITQLSDVKALTQEIFDDEFLHALQFKAALDLLEQTKGEKPKEVQPKREKPNA